MMKRYAVIDTHEDAQAALLEPWGHVVIEGDSGGEVFVVCPTTSIKSSVRSLFLLMHDLESIQSVGTLSEFGEGDDFCFPGYDAWICQIDIADNTAYQNAIVSKQLWVNPEFVRMGLAGQIQEVLLGTRDRLSSPTPPSLRPL
jgi:hypothetical protein